MKISVRVKPNARKDLVSPQGDGTYIVSVTAPPVEGKANDRLIQVLAEYFKKRKRDITIVSGSAGRHKVVQID